MLAEVHFSFLCLIDYGIWFRLPTGAVVRRGAVHTGAVVHRRAVYTSLCPSLYRMPACAVVRPIAV